MFGFLFKILIVAVIVGGGLWYFGVRQGMIAWADLANPARLLSQLPIDTVVLDKFTQVKPGQLGGQISTALDTLVTHPNRNSPVVLGVKVTNDTIGTVTDVLMGLPPDKLEQIRNVVCTPK